MFSSAVPDGERDASGQRTARPRSRRRPPRSPGPLVRAPPGHPQPERSIPWAANASPADNGNGNGSGTKPGTCRDLRPPERRRAEALIEICRRAAAAGGSAPATTKAQILVTIDHHTLKHALRGAGHTLDGTVLSPQTVRKLACDASIIPMVLGSSSQPLDVGRTKRLVTPALLAALWARDKGCTFPGCGRPPQWADAHHVKHWIDGGPTALLNMALLCGYHHTYVHQHDLTATVTAHDVTWQT